MRERLLARRERFPLFLAAGDVYDMVGGDGRGRREALPTPVELSVHHRPLFSLYLRRA